MNFKKGDIISVRNITTTCALCVCEVLQEVGEYKVQVYVFDKNMNIIHTSFEYSEEMDFVDDNYELNIKLNRGMMLNNILG